MPWEATYRNDRRKHRHRCLCCARIIQPGERVVMTRVRHGTKAVHAEPCGESRVDGMSWRERFAAWEADRAAEATK